MVMMPFGFGGLSTITISPDGRWMYFTDTPTRTIRRYPYDPETGDIGKAQPFYLTPDRAGYPDGTCVDENGALWNARFWGGCVQQILADASNGARVEVPAPQVTCACFGGPDLDRLYITTAQEDLPDAKKAAFPLSGALFVAEPGVKGLPEARFARSLF